MNAEATYFKNHADAIVKATGRGRVTRADAHTEMQSRAIASLLESSQNQGKWLMGLTDRALTGGKTERPKHEFFHLGEQLQAVAAAARGFEPLDWRLEFQQRAALGANEKVGADGSYLVQADFSNQLLEAVAYESELASRCTEIPLSAKANSVKLPRIDETSRADGSRWGGVRAYWADEAQSVTASTSKFGRLEMTANKVIAIIYVTDELLSDSAALGAWMMRVGPGELAFKLDAAVADGTGAGQPLGILRAPSLITVAKESGQGAATVQTENLNNMLSRLPASSVKRAVWYISQSCIPQLAGLTTAAGAARVVDWPSRTILGTPFVPIEQAAKVGTVGDIILADMSKYLLLTKGGVQVTSSIHVQFLTDQQAFRFVYRVDGQPEWPRAMTPFNGGPTESPFVVLETRG